MINSEKSPKIGILSTAKNSSLVQEVMTRMELVPPERYEVVVIPTAGNENGRENNNFADNAINALGLVGFSDIKELDISGYRKGKLDAAEEIKNALTPPLAKGYGRVLVITGGNIHFLRHHLEESGADDLIKDEVLSGHLALVTISAGSINIGQTLALTGSENAIGLSHTNGMNLVNFGVVCHYTPEKEAQLKQKIESAALAIPRIVTITDEQALVGNGQEFKVVGKGSITVFERNPEAVNYSKRETTII